MQNSPLRKLFAGNRLPLPSLARTLNLRNNFLVAKAAAVSLHHHLTSLTHHLVAAFPRFLENSSKSDPQCWAKNALARALAAFEYQEPEIFLSGMRHIQREPKPSAAPPPPRKPSRACSNSAGPASEKKRTLGHPF